MSEDFRAATDQERSLVEYLARAPGVPSDALLPQLQGLQARPDCTCGCPSVALRVADGVAVDDQVGNLEITAGCPNGILLLFVRGGRLTSLELAGLHDAATAWPTLEVLTPPTAD